MKPKDKKLKKNKKGGMPKKKDAGKKTKELSDMSVDDMFSMIQNDDDNDDDDLMDTESKNVAKKKKAGLKKTKTKVKKVQENTEDDDLDFEDDEDLSSVTKLNRKDYLETLKKNDPHFYDMMMQSSDVMDLRSSDEEDETNILEEESSDEEDPERGGAIFQPPTKLEVDSDESDAEEEGLQHRGDNTVTAAMTVQWEKDLKGSSPLNAFVEVEQAFLAAIESLGTRGKEETEITSKYKVEGPQIFNAVVRLCLKNVPPALAKILNLKSPKDDPTKSKKWGKIKNFIKAYLRNLVKLTECVAEPSIAEVIISRGVLPLISYYAGHPSTCRLLLRRLITLWATSEKRVRVLAFIGIFRLTQILPPQFLEWALKRLYLSYVQNSRFTSPSTWGLIDFMRISLVELYSLDQVRAYKHAFVYIRQMAFHLRNAITLKKKERVQLVYNWQYIHCLHLWADLLAKTHPSPALEPIIYPLTQIAMGTMKLQPSPAFYPLVFHVCGILTDLSRHTGTFIPVLPFLLEILNKAHLEKKHKKASIKPFDWLCMLRLSRAEMAESAFKDGVVDQVYDGIINYLSVESSSIGFPELVVPATLQLKSFLKMCKVPNYTKKIKQLLEKIKENQNFIESKRKDATFGIADKKSVKDWEIAVKQAGTPLSTYHVSWLKVREKEHLRRISNRVEMDDYNLPVVRKRELIEKQKAKDKDELKELFASDEDDDEDTDDETRFLSKSERTKLKNKKGKDNPELEDGHDESPDEEDDVKEEEDEDDDDEDEDTGKPPRKKKKTAIGDIGEEMDNMDIAHEEDDVVKEMKLSDFESDDEQVDDFGDGSDDSED
ncbi:nucleolar complex protein 2 homolog [Homarus americanus]|uniref:Nucleolar complex protein 2-like n=1 Tax=Homarus americanus TaxID=6706 RepID=A0A8J5JII5_HOMAM|nr:nucleolar complex protein 2 homolog [Homarus americanus]KAG7153729.1 Nucleolar complex protein 2-like [Homarus americanus]